MFRYYKLLKHVRIMCTSIFGVHADGNLSKNVNKWNELCLAARQLNKNASCNSAFIDSLVSFLELRL